MKAGEQMERTARRASTALTEGTRTALDFVIEPEFVADLREEVTWIGQWIAAFLLIIIVPLTFKFTVIFHRLLVTLVLRGLFSGAESGAFIVTLLTLLFFTISCWLWFQWVRTGGFGLFRFSFGGDA